MNEDIVVPIAGMVMTIVLFVGFPIALAYSRRLWHQPVPPKIPDDVAARLERMEQAIDSIAIEVERISEGQRFTTKLLSDRVEAEPVRRALPPREPGA